MTNTKFRRRALVSSIAMLLVALVALGSATFAWFSTTTTATAESMTAATVKSSNLLVSEDKTSWGQSVTFATAGFSGSSMNPITTADFDTWQYAQADTYDGIVAGTAAGAGSALATKSTSAGTDYAHATLYVRYGETVTTAVRNLKVTINDLATSSTNGYNYIRVAFVPMAANSTAGITASTLTAPAVYGNASDDWSKDAANFDGTAATNKTVVTTNSLSNISLGNITEGKVYGFDIYVYFEGTDPDCKDTNSGGTFSGIDFSLDAGTVV